MPATHKTPVYKALEISNPFASGGDKAFADILKDKMDETRKWRIVGLSSLVLFVIALILFASAINMQHTVPVLVNVMPSGEAQFLGEVRQGAGIQVPEAAIHHWITRFITNLRTVPTDFQVMYNNIDESFVMVTAAYAVIMRNMLINDSPFELIGRIRRSVEIESILPITANSYQVNWNETVIDTQARQTVTRMRAVVTIRLLTPTDAIIRRNPLGIFIENFEMTAL